MMDTPNTSDTPLDAHALHAYVDGRLPPEQLPRVLAWLGTSIKVTGVACCQPGLRCSAMTVVSPFALIAAESATPRWIWSFAPCTRG